MSEELKPVPWGWYLGILAVICLSLGALWAGFGAVPDPMPVHWGPAGEPDRFTDKSLGSAFGLVALGPGILLVTGAGSAAMINWRAREADNAYPTRTAREINRARLSANLQQPVLGAWMLLLAALVTFAVTGSLLGWLSGYLSTVVIFGGVLATMVWFFLRMRKVTLRVDETHPPEEPGQKLKWGMIYYNPDDERAVVDLEGGSMTTFNFARPAAWGILAALLAPMALIVVLAVVAG